MAILLTGGMGFIGSHTAVELINEGYEVIIADNLSNSSPKVLERIETITGTKPLFYEIDVAVKKDVEKVFDENKIEGVVHFAGYKSVPESTRIPLNYYRNNIDTALTVLEVMKERDCRTFVFSSSATVYGDKNKAPFNEEMPTSTSTNAYGNTKLMIEQIVRDFSASWEDFSAALLRYFNPIGAHPSGLIGEAPDGIPNNLMPYITQTAVGVREFLGVFGTDYDTPDGTGVRDFIHVVDLARGHVAAIGYALKSKGTEAVNLGTGNGSSVLEVVHTFEEANDLKIPVKLLPRRPGDVATSFALAIKAKELLGWEAKLTLFDMCKDSWNWQKNNPRGYN